MWRLEQKSANFLKDIICKFMKPGDLLLEDCYGPIPTGRACVLLQQRLRIVECERVQNCVDEATQWLAEPISLAGFDQASRFHRIKNSLKAAKTSGDALDGIAAKKQADVWAVRKRLAAVQVFPKLIRHFMGMYFKDEGLFNKTTVILLCHNGARSDLYVYMEWM